MISSIKFRSNDIAMIIQELFPNKAHGYDVTNVHMLKICGESTFKFCNEKNQFPNEWEKIKVVPTHMKVITECQESTDLFHYFQYRVKYLNI